MIEVKELNLKLGKNNILKNISLKVEPNKIYGLLGRNGAGKTTLLNAIVGGFSETKGIIKINEINPYVDGAVLNNVCIVRENIIKPLLTSKVQDYFKSYSILYPKFDMNLAIKLAAHFKINLKCIFNNLSRGMQTMVINIVGICSMADILIFDEPTIGMDAQNRAEFYEILLEHFATHQQTIIISTHQIDETQNLFNHVFIINKGELIVDSEIDELECKPTELQDYFINLTKEGEFIYE
ncbi:hypothetical protein AN639_02045 [Candidatus Epulonipiscium fishelsonii]|uniref:Uncharacterized protein n=1 Tax=Candidatus Epulonipiscium fishelsonii TaxID=77094 RepID=A0ACC8XFF7_9FIRM|nr:hypothetical protein AN396_02180 [Epulopiscium sp. SCG-B11WGA-EpuloA1]ONI43856.1 hypothetical protein AN639_02045 [Epulopiscium sp. SCG-B05WGA-EpuloA1]